MGETIHECNEVPVVKEFDVIVAGGGIAGVSAALAAGRNGAKTLLIEKSVMLGGLATLGCIAIYLPLCDGRGRKVIGGIAEELLHLSIKYGYNNLPEPWKTGSGQVSCDQRYRTIFSPAEFVIALDEVMEKEGIEVAYDTLISTPVMDQGRCRYLIVENKTGRTAYKCKMVVDATGDADIFHRAGAHCDKADNWLSYWSYMTSLDDMRKAVEQNDITLGVKLHTGGSDDRGNNAPKGYPKYDGTIGDEVTKFVMDGRRILRQEMIESKKEQFCIVSLPGIAQFRTTRRIVGRYELSEEDVFKCFDDSVGCTGDWRKAGPVYEIPYRTLITEETENMIAAGRCISSKWDAWQFTRVIPTAALTGQAAGTAAAIAAEIDCTLQEVPLDKLQKLLIQTGVILHL